MALVVDPLGAKNTAIATPRITSFMDTTSQLPHFVGGKARRTSIALDFPVEFDGITYSEIGLRRLTAGEVSAFMDIARAIVKADPDANPRAPIFTTTDGAPIPDGLFDALDDDDALRLDEAAASFLPRRFQADREASASTPTAGSDTEPTS